VKSAKPASPRVLFHFHKTGNIMNKLNVFFIALCAFVLVACNKTEEPHAAKVEATQAATQDAAKTGKTEDAITASARVCSDPKMPELAKKHNCTACHELEKNCVGPAWTAVAKMYKGAEKYTYIDKTNGNKEYSLHEGLIKKVSKGGADVWGTMPMPANDPAGKKQTEIKELVDYILALAK
jgi:cytochrome c